MAMSESETVEGIIQAYRRDHLLFEATLAELQAQLAQLASAPAAAKPSELMQRVYDKAPSERLAAHLRGQLPRRPPGPEFANRLDENLALLGIIAADLRRQLGALQARLQAAAVELRQGGAERLPPPPSAGEEEHACTRGDAVLALAAAADGLARETELVERVAGGVSLLTPADEVGAYGAVLQVQPYLDGGVLDAAVALDSLLGPGAGSDGRGSGDGGSCNAPG